MLHMIVFAGAMWDAESSATPPTEPAQALMPLRGKVPREILLTTPAFVAELKLPPPIAAALAAELAARRRAVDELGACLLDPKLSEVECALRLAAVAENAEADLARHRERLAAALGPAAARLEQLERQVEGPLGAYSPARRKELGIDEEKWPAVQRRLNDWKGRASVAGVTGKQLFPFGNHLRKTEELAAPLFKEIEDTLGPQEQERWRASLGERIDVAPIMAAATARMGRKQGIETTYSRNGNNPTRPLSLRAVREWLKMTDAQQQAWEEMEQARDQTAAAVERLLAVPIEDLPDRFYQRYWMGSIDRGVYSDRVFALLDAEQAKNAQRLYFWNNGARCVLSGRWRSAFGADNALAMKFMAAEGKAFKELGKQFAAAKQADKPLSLRQKMEIVKDATDAAALAQLSPAQQKLWADLNTGELPPKELCWSYREHVRECMPREPYVPKP